jgi:benzoylformate decarboxylase
MYSIQALYSAAELRLPITFIVLNNRRYAALQEFAPVFKYKANEKPVGTDLPGIDFVGLSEAQGVRASRVEDPQQLKSALQVALQAEGPCLLDVFIA